MIAWIVSLWAGVRLLFRRRPALSAYTGTDTEFSAEVVQITEVLPHPNADRLDIVHFAMASGPTVYDVVIQKGTFKVGDLAAYFSVDCLLPTAHEAFAFLTGRLDGAGKDVYRLRAARLRGVFSQGLMVPAPLGLTLGDSVAELFGVGYHRAAEPAENTNQQPSKKPRKQPLPIYGVESLKKVPRMFSDEEPVLVTEKCHGSNARWSWIPKTFLGIRYGWRFVVGSHRVIKEGQGNHFYDEDVWTMAAKNMRLAERTAKYKGYAFYGELYGHTYTGQKIQDLTYGRGPSDGPGLMCFDILAPDGTWLPWSERAEILEACSLDHVPILHMGVTTRADILAMAEGKSTLDNKTQREGVVVEALEGARRKAKYVGEGYLMRKGAA